MRLNDASCFGRGCASRCVASPAPPWRTSSVRRTSNCVKPAPIDTTCCGKCRRSAMRGSAVQVRFPSGTVQVTPPRGVFADGAYVERWQVQRDGGFAGAQLHIDGIAAGVTDVIVRIEHADGTSQVERLLAAASRLSSLRGRTTAGEVAWSYLVLGVHHILGGVDHLLFVLGLLLIVRGGKRIVAHRHRIHRCTQHHAGCGDARLGARAGSAGRSDDRAQHRVRGSGSGARTARPPGTHGARAVGRRVHLRPAARLRFRRRTGGSRACRSTRSRSRC